MTKQVRSKRIVAIIIVLVIAFSLSVQAYAAPWDSIGTSPGGGGRPYNSFSGITGTMNALFGGDSARWPISSGTLPRGSYVTGVTITLTVSSGSAPCYIIIMCPCGDIVTRGPYGPGTYTINISDFNGCPGQGTWYVWIRTTGSVSTATARMVVNYFYP